MSLLISRSDLGNPEQAGNYEFDGAIVHVENKHVCAWIESPLTSFKAIRCTRAGDRVVRFALGQPVLQR
jgi:hypothetical protein